MKQKDLHPQKVASDRLQNLLRIVAIALLVTTVVFVIAHADESAKPPTFRDVADDYLAMAHRAAESGNFDELKAVIDDSAVVDSRMYTVKGRDKIISRLDFFLKRFGITNVKLLPPNIIDRDSIAVVSGMMKYTLDVWGLPEYNGTQYYKSEWRRDTDDVWRVYLIKEVPPPQSN